MLSTTVYQLWCNDCGSLHSVTSFGATCNIDLVAQTETTDDRIDDYLDKWTLIDNEALR